MLPGVVAVLLSESVSWAVKLNVPGVVGVPDTVPLGFSFSPLGSVPAFAHL